MCVKLPATLNIQLKYVFYTQGLHKVRFCGYHYFVTKKKIHSGDAQLSVVSVYISLAQGWEFDSKWRLKGVEIDI